MGLFHGEYKGSGEEEKGNYLKEIGNPIDRRSFLKALGVLGIGMILNPTVVLGSDESDKNHENTSNDLVDKHLNHLESDLPEWLDYSTAFAVTADFVRLVIYKGMLKPEVHKFFKLYDENETDLELRARNKERAQAESLGIYSAIEMNTTAFARIFLLKYFGGNEGKHLAEHEIAELYEGLKPLPVLVALSDITSEHMEVNEKKIFEAMEEINEQERFSVRRPDMGQGREVWLNYLRNVNASISKKVTQIASLTFILAPLGTTYMSSAIANKMKMDVMKLLYEQSYSKAVLGRVYLKNGEIKEAIPESEIRSYAKKRTDTYFNGVFGFSKMMLALTANTNGGFGAGDPPQLYFYLRNYNKPMTLAMGEGIGLASSVFYTATCNFGWLVSIGALNSNTFSDFKESLQLSISSVTRLFTDKENLRDVSFMDASAYSQRVYEAIKYHDSKNSENLEEILASIPKADYRFSFRSYLKEKGDTLRRVILGMPRLTQSQLSKTLLVEGDDEMMDSHGNRFQEYSDFHVSGQLDELRNCFKKGDFFSVQRALSILRTLERQFQNHKSSEISEVFEQMISDVKNQKQPERNRTTEASSPIDSKNQITPEDKKTALRAKLFGELIGDFTKLDHFGMGKISSLGKRLRENPDLDTDEIVEKLSQVNIDTLAEALSKATSVNGKSHHEDHVSSHDPEKLNDAILRKKDLETKLTEYEKRKNKIQISLESGVSVTSDEYELSQIQDLIDRLKLEIQSVDKEINDLLPTHGDSDQDIVSKAIKYLGIEKQVERLSELTSHSAREVFWALSTQIPSVAGLSRMAKLILPSFAGVEKGNKPTPEQLKKICFGMLIMTATLSGHADNVAAYLFASTTLKSFIHETFSEDVLQDYSTLDAEVESFARVLAEQAGSLTKVGNGPNFTQESIDIYDDENDPLGVRFERREMTMGETYKNGYSWYVNSTTIAGMYYMLSRTIDSLVKIEEGKKHVGSLDVETTRRGFFGRIRDLFSGSKT